MNIVIDGGEVNHSLESIPITVTNELMDQAFVVPWAAILNRLT